jgi:hypothetical protein
MFDLHFFGISKKMQAALLFVAFAVLCSGAPVGTPIVTPDPVNPDAGMSKIRNDFFPSILQFLIIGCESSANCQIRPGGIVDCSGLGLTVVPCDSIPRDVTEL